MQKTRVVAMTGLLCLVGGTVRAQDAPQLVPGARVRVQASSQEDRLVGRLLTLDESQLRLQMEDEQEPRVLRREDITHLDVSAGRRSRGRGALIGGLVGAAAGAAVGAATASDPDPDKFIDITWDADEGALGGALLLGSVGALVGLLIPPAERWRDVPLEEGVRLSLRPVRGRGAGLFVTVRF